MRCVPSPRANRALYPRQRQHRKHPADHFVKKLLKRSPDSRESALALEFRICHQICRGHLPILAYCQFHHCLAFFAAHLYRWPVNRLETTPSLALVSNLSQSYNRKCGRGEPALQLDDHLKNLLRELGHAINDTVSDSDRITGAIAGVRAHGYDIVLKLDATIGLARRDAAGNQDSKLTTLDRRFLESLRIQVDQDSFNEPDLEKKAVAKLAMTPQDIRFLKSLRIATDELE